MSPLSYVLGYDPLHNTDYGFKVKYEKLDDQASGSWFGVLYLSVSSLTAQYSGVRLTDYALRRFASRSQPRTLALRLYFTASLL